MRSLCFVIQTPPRGNLAAVPAAFRRRSASTHLVRRETMAAMSDAREKLKRHFSGYQGEEYAKGWASLWETSDFLPWDRGKPSPALEDTLVNHRDVVGSATIDGTRKKALVPGCGRGVDVLLLESYGYDVVGLEVSEGAVKACLKYAQEHGSDYPVKDDKAGKGSKKFVLGDFYKNDFLEDAGLTTQDYFHLIFDYTFFCAMHPNMRPAWAQRMSDLLANTGNLICLEFPTDMPPSTGGPPFGSSPHAYVEHLSHPGQNVPYDDEGNVKFQPLAESSPGGLERVGHWHPNDTHAVGKDDAGNVKDYISVWRHK